MPALGTRRSSDAFNHLILSIAYASQNDFLARIAAVIVPSSR